MTVTGCRGFCYNPPMHYLIIGGGIAGTTAAETLRKLAAKCDITIISAERHPLYSRVMLPHYVSGKTPRERVFLKSPEWYNEQNIHLAFHTVVALEPASKTVTVDGGHTYSYDKLLIAGGGHVRHLPFDDGHIQHFQTVEDADAIVALIARLKNESHPAVGIIGGGFISMDFIKLFAPLGIATHVFLRNDRYFTPSFDVEMSHMLTEHLSEHGVVTHLQTEIASWDGSLAKTIGGGALPLHALTAGVGLICQYPWAKEAGVEVGHGIRTNEFLETNIKDVYAAGDCAEFFDVLIERHQQAGNWLNAQMQGQHVARVMHGERAPFHLVSSYSATMFGKPVVAVGCARHDVAEETVVRDSGDGRTLLFLHRGRLVGASMFNRPDDRAGATKLVEAKVDLSNRHGELADPEVPLLSLL